MPTGRIIRVFTIGFFVAALATLCVMFALSLVGAVIDELAMGDFGAAVYVFLVAFVAGAFCIGLVWVAWSSFARYAHKEIGLKLPGYNEPEV